MEISIPLYDAFFEILRRNATPASSVSRILEASVKNVLNAGARNIITVRCPLAVAEDLRVLAAKFCPHIAPIIAAVIAARSARFSPGSTISENRRTLGRPDSNNS
jgi:hypothetical protein